MLVLSPETQAALRQDSLQLARLSAADSPVVWALRMARSHRDTLAQWTGQYLCSAGPMPQRYLAGSATS